MRKKFKGISIKNDTYCFVDDISNIKIFDPNNIKIDEKSLFTGCSSIKHPVFQFNPSS